MCYNTLIIGNIAHFCNIHFYIEMNIYTKEPLANAAAGSYHVASIKS